MDTYVRKNGAVVRPWAKADEDWLKENASNYTIAELLERFPDRTVDTLKYRMGRLGVRQNVDRIVRSCGRVYRAYSAAEEETIRELAGTMPVAEIASKLGRSDKSVIQHCYLRKIAYAYEKPVWTKHEEFRLLGLCERHTIIQMAEILGRSYQAVYHKMRELHAKPLCGVYSLTEAMRITGYAQTQLHAARRALNQNWKTVKWRWGRYTITEDQLKRCCDWLRGALNGRLRVASVQRAA